MVPQTQPGIYVSSTIITYDSDQFDYYETEMLCDDEDLTHNIFVKIKFNVTDME